MVYKSKASPLSYLQYIYMSSLITNHSVHDLRIQCRQSTNPLLKHFLMHQLWNKGFFTQSKTLAEVGCGRQVTVFAPTRGRRGGDKKHCAGLWLCLGCRWAERGRLAFCVLFTIVWTVRSDVTARVSGTVVQFGFDFFWGRFGLLFCLSVTLIIICIRKKKKMIDTDVIITSSDDCAWIFMGFLEVCFR